MSQIEIILKLKMFYENCCKYRGENGVIKIARKSLKKFGNETTLSLLVKRLKTYAFLDDIVIATTINSKDDLICDWC